MHFIGIHTRANNSEENTISNWWIIYTSTSQLGLSECIVLCSDIDTLSSRLRNPHVLPLLADIKIPCRTSSLALPVNVLLDSLFRVLLFLLLVWPFFLVMIMYGIMMGLCIASCRGWPRVVHTFWFLLFFRTCSFPKTKSLVFLRTELRCSLWMVGPVFCCYREPSAAHFDWPSELGPPDLIQSY